MSHKHAAYNLETGEVITTNNGNHLKRCVARASRWNRTHGYPVGTWIFAHGKDKEQRLRQKIASC